MEEMIAYCGYRCDLCAARSDNPELRQKLVDLWRKYYGHEMYTVENVRCDGCKGNGRRADTQCKINPCAIEKGVETCAHCDEFPCDILKNTAGIQSKEDFYKRSPETSQEDFNIAMRMFCNKPILMKIREGLGKES